MKEIMCQLCPEACKKAGVISDSESPAVDVSLRVQLGILMRQLKELWRVSVVLAACLDAPGARGVNELDEADAITALEAADTEHKAVLDASAASRAALCAEMDAEVERLGLNGVWNLKPLLGGKEIMQVTGAKGPRVGILTSKALEWQLANPHATKEDGLAWLEQSHESLG